MVIMGERGLVLVFGPASYKLAHRVVRVLQLPPASVHSASWVQFGSAELRMVKPSVSFFFRLTQHNKPNRSELPAELRVRLQTAGTGSDVRHVSELNDTAAESSGRTVNTPDGGTRASCCCSWCWRKERSIPPPKPPWSHVTEIWRGWSYRHIILYYIILIILYYIL